MSDTQATKLEPLTYTSEALPPPLPCTSPSHDVPATRLVQPEGAIFPYEVCELHDPTRHATGANCPACPDNETWNRVHCYHCGAPDLFHPRHEGCFQ